MLEQRELLTDDDLRAARDLLAREGLGWPEGADWSTAVFDDGTVAATGFLGGNVIMGVCVDSDRRGEDLSARIVTALLKRANAVGLEHIFLFTKPSMAERFAAMGFKRVAEAPERAALLEFGWPDFAQWMRTLKADLGPAFDPAPAPVGAIVMNANPFTLGHRHLVRSAAAECATTYVFVVQEDSSVVPYAVRLALVRAGTADISGCVVLPGGPYMVTRATFPSYFTGAEGHAPAHAALDATIFAGRIAPPLGITRRYLGTEPYCPVTRAYNGALAEILPRAGVEVRIVERLANGGEAVSASRLRDMLRTGSLEGAENLAPATTLEWLRSSEAAPVIAALAKGHGRHD
ncbi:MAG: [citrate (pro-3S)-lyase] ligase [Desulfovibrionaceae bacterium]|jgi:[citrate (pro-3S)-lyase] ligase|nr:[citrate (pro-3S)-lyase] ligase [Desulfovibrionaceae bacterium]